MCYLASTIARYFIEESKGKKTPMQLIKMTYIAHGWSLAINNKPLIVEDVEAWKYGPVIPSLYYEFKKYGKNPVPYIPIEETNYIKPDDKKLLDKIIEVYGYWNGLQLSANTHKEGTPWHQTKKWYTMGNPIIPEKIIRDYYIEKYKQTNEGN